MKDIVQHTGRKTRHSRGSIQCFASLQQSCPNPKHRSPESSQQRERRMKRLGRDSDLLDREYCRDTWWMVCHSLSHCWPVYSRRGSSPGPGASVRLCNLSPERWSSMCSRQRKRFHRLEGIVVVVPHCSTRILNSCTSSSRWNLEGSSWRTRERERQGFTYRWNRHHPRRDFHWRYQSEIERLTRWMDCHVQWSDSDQEFASGWRIHLEHGRWSSITGQRDWWRRRHFSREHRMETRTRHRWEYRHWLWSIPRRRTKVSGWRAAESLPRVDSVRRESIDRWETVYRCWRCWHHSDICKDENITEIHSDAIVLLEEQRLNHGSRCHGCLMMQSIPKGNKRIAHH